MNVLKRNTVYIASIVMLIVTMIAALFAFTQTAHAVDCSVLPDSICNATDESDVEQNSVWLILVLVVNILAAGVAVAAVGGIIYGAIMYTTSSGDPGQVKKAVEIIRNVVIGVILFFMMWSLSQWLIPGGAF